MLTATREQENAAEFFAARYGRTALELREDGSATIYLYGDDYPIGTVDVDTDGDYLRGVTSLYGKQYDVAIMEYCDELVELGVRG